MKYPLSISKEDISKLPRYYFSGEILVVETKEDALHALELIKYENVLGFDTETRASFKKGESYDVALLQLATPSFACLFRLNKFKMFAELAAILSDPHIVKAGVAIRDDIKGLQKLYDFEDQGFVELADLAKENGFEKFSLRALTAIFLNKKLSKKEKVSNWERSDLTPGQIDYAACDAIVGFEIYQKFQELRPRV